MHNTQKTAHTVQADLLLDVSNRENQARASISQSSNEANRLVHVVRKHNEGMDRVAAQVASREIAAHDEIIRAKSAELKDLEIEREHLVRGTDPRVTSHFLTDQITELAGQQAAHAKTLARFQAAASLELKAAAKELVDSCVGMRLDPPALAQFITQHA